METMEVEEFTPKGKAAKLEFGSGSQIAESLAWIMQKNYYDSASVCFNNPKDVNDKTLVVISSEFNIEYFPIKNNVLYGVVREHFSSIQFFDEDKFSKKYRTIKEG